MKKQAKLSTQNPSPSPSGRKYAVPNSFWLATHKWNILCFFSLVQTVHHAIISAFALSIDLDLNTNPVIINLVIVVAAGLVVYAISSGDQGW